ncbi:MAG TPA: hypothetical protein VFK47_15155, partial [Ktedonobacteraceae bacterium]|nr:hypothetical protein [Ktedonobacteraceae bacterium]
MQNTQHPLDPLTEEEIALTTRILNDSGRMTDKMRRMAYSLQEPAKEEVLAYHEGQQLPREVFVVIRDHERRLTIEALVNLNEQSIRSWRERNDVQPALTYPEVFAAMGAVFDDAAFQAALERRGIALSSAVL